MFGMNVVLVLNGVLVVSCKRARVCLVGVVIVSNFQLEVVIELTDIDLCLKRTGIRTLDRKEM